MKGFLKRLLFYLIGFSLGVLILKFSGAKLPSLFPSTIIYDEIREKPFLIDTVQQNTLDSLSLSNEKIWSLLAQKEIDYQNSNTSGDTCKTYIFIAETDSLNYTISVKKCDSMSILKKITAQ